MTTNFWYNGQAQTGDQLSLDITDPGLLYGATVFSTLRVYYGDLDHPLTAWQQHHDRLSQSLQQFGWQQPNWQRLQTGAAELAQQYPVLRITLFPDGREWITGRSLPADLAQRQTQGINVWIVEDGEDYEGGAAHKAWEGNWGRRSLPHHKTGNYLTPWLGLQQLQTPQMQAMGVQEAILTDAHGNWLETLTGNLWGWAEGIWYTPSLEVGILPGIQRDRLLRELKSHPKIVIESIWDQALIDRLEVLAYSNCVVEMVPIRTVLSRQNMRSPRTDRYNPEHHALGELRQMLFPGDSQMS